MESFIPRILDLCNINNRLFAKKDRPLSQTVKVFIPGNSFTADILSPPFTGERELHTV